MIRNVKIISISGKKLISFNEGNKLIFIDGSYVHTLNFRARLLGVIGDKLIVSIKNRYLVSLSSSTFLLDLVIYKGPIEAHANSDTAIWFQCKNQVFYINSDMKISLYDDFSHTRLINIIYLHVLKTVAFIIQADDGIRIHFDDSYLNTLFFSGIFQTPEIYFESEHEIIFSIGRGMIKCDLQKGKIQVLKITNPISLRFKSLSLTIDYKISHTEIVISNSTLNKIHIDGDLWKMINHEDSIYIFSESINKPICIHIIKTNGELINMYENKTLGYWIDLECDELNKSKYCPLISLRKTKLTIANSDSKAIFFIHGGPHQKAGNLWDPLHHAFLKQNYVVYIPQYSGTVGFEKSKNFQPPLYGIEDLEDLKQHYTTIKLRHERVIVVGHSYGAFLALKLFIEFIPDILVGINGVYDLHTISELNPKTYSHLNQDEKTHRSSKLNQTNFIEKNEWHHIQFLKDPLISKEALSKSLSRVGARPTIHYLDFHGHGSFNEFQSKKIVDVIVSIENQFYNKLYLRETS